VPEYKEITPEEADALVEAGADVRYRFRGWEKEGPHSNYPWSYLAARYHHATTPLTFWSTYNKPEWIHTGTPTFLVEVE